MAKRTNKNSLVIIDISNPRNVEKVVQEVTGTKLYNIDDLTLIAEKNKLERQKSIDKALRILDEELVILDQDMKSLSVRLIISALLSQAEHVRQKELATALNMIGDANEREKKILEDLTSILLKQTFVPIVENLRSAAKDGDMRLIELAVKLFEKTEKN
jgi:glutamyl-tRNA reductase